MAANAFNLHCLQRNLQCTLTYLINTTVEQQNGAKIMTDRHFHDKPQHQHDRKYDHIPFRQQQTPLHGTHAKQS